MEQLTREINKVEEELKDPKIDEALDLINRSARHKKNALKRLISDRYTDIRDSLATEATGALRKSPWLIISGIAASFLVIGYFIGNTKK